MSAVLPDRRQRVGSGGNIRFPALHQIRPAIRNRHRETGRDIARARRRRDRFSVGAVEGYQQIERTASGPIRPADADYIAGRRIEPGGIHVTRQVNGSHQGLAVFDLLQVEVFIQFMTRIAPQDRQRIATGRHVRFPAFNLVRSVGCNGGHDFSHLVPRRAGDVLAIRSVQVNSADEGAGTRSIANADFHDIARRRREPGHVHVPCLVDRAGLALAVPDFSKVRVPGRQVVPRIQPNQGDGVTARRRIRLLAFDRVVALIDQGFRYFRVLLAGGCRHDIAGRTQQRHIQIERTASRAVPHANRHHIARPAVEDIGIRFARRIDGAAHAVAILQYGSDIRLHGNRHFVRIAQLSVKARQSQDIGSRFGKCGRGLRLRRVAERDRPRPADLAPGGEYDIGRQSIVCNHPVQLIRIGYHGNGIRACIGIRRLVETRVGLRVHDDRNLVISGQITVGGR